jgi:hypothetical protein
MVAKAIAERKNLKIFPRVMGSCPPVNETKSFLPEERGENCETFNRLVRDELRQGIEAGDVAAVVMGGRWQAYLRYMSPTALADRMRERIGWITSQGVPVVLLAPVPNMTLDPVNCLARNSVEHCSVAKKADEKSRTASMQAIRLATKGNEAVSTWDPGPYMCDAERCYVSADDVVFYGDKIHLSLMGSLYLAPHFAPTLLNALERRVADRATSDKWRLN